MEHKKSKVHHHRFRVRNKKTAVRLQGEQQEERETHSPASSHHKSYAAAIYLD